MPLHRAHIALGANLADRAAAIAAAIDALASHPAIALIAQSSLHDTEPLGPPDQPRYLNAAVAIDTTLSPHALIGAMLDIERALGRDRSADALRWGPRTIDLDLLTYADLTLSEPALTIPHPRMHERAFVLAPLAEIAPDLIHPVLRRSIADLLDAMEHSQPPPVQSADTP